MLQTVKFLFHCSLQSQEHRASFVKLGQFFVFQFQVNRKACVAVVVFPKYIWVAGKDRLDLLCSLNNLVDYLIPEFQR